MKEEETRKPTKDRNKPQTKKPTQNKPARIYTTVSSSFEQKTIRKNIYSNQA